MDAGKKRSRDTFGMGSVANPYGACLIQQVMGGIRLGANRRNSTHRRVATPADVVVPQRFCSTESLQAKLCHPRYCAGYDPDLPTLKGDPRLNPGKGIGTNWHPSQPIR